MRIAHNSVCTVFVVLNYIGITSCMPPKTMNLLENFGRSNEHAHNQGDPRGETSTPKREHPPTTPLPNRGFPLDARIISPISSSTQAERLTRSRSRSPPVVDKTSPSRPFFPNVLGYGLDQLEFIRLIPLKNPQRKLKLLRFTFPADKRIKVLEGPHKYGPITTKKQIVVSTLDGDVFATLDGTDTLAGIYVYDISLHSTVRAKINMINGHINSLTADEIRETPVGPRRQFLYSYRVEHSNLSHGSLPPAETPIHHASGSSRSMTLPTRLPSSDGFGYELDELQFIQLIPMQNRRDIFELRKYTFPADKLILFLEERNHYVPVPIRELIVLATISGDVFAILEDRNHLSGIYTYNSQIGTKGRVKINLRNGTVTQLTKHEMLKVPVGRLRPILFNFEVRHIGHISPGHLVE